MFPALLFVLIMTVWMESKAQERNVALNEKVWHKEKFIGYNLVDGNRIRTCFRLDLRENNTKVHGLFNFEIYLNVPYYIVRIAVYFSTDGFSVCSTRLRLGGVTVGLLRLTSAVTNVTFSPLLGRDVDAVFYGCIGLFNRVDLCEVEVYAIPVCSTNPCRNNATCNGSYTNYTCECEPSYTGKNCERDVDECAATSPCQNGAVCENTVGGYGCRCSAGYTGKHCSTDIDDCFDMPCLHGGTCRDQVNGFNCTCKTGYEGGQCEDDSAATAHSVGHSSGLRIGLGAGVGAGLGLALLGVLLVLFLRRHRRNKNNDYLQIAYDVINKAENFEEAPTPTQEAVAPADTVVD